VRAAGFGNTGPILAAARAVARDEIDLAAIDTRSFRFGKMLDYRDPQFLPGGAKYLDLPGLLALGAPRPLWLTGEERIRATLLNMYRELGRSNNLTIFPGDRSEQESKAA